MMSSNLGLILDGVILVFLAVTIFYASRLTIFLKNFRQSRETVETLIRNLSVAIDKAEIAIKDMHNLSDESKNNLQDAINEASFLSDELRFMNESGDNLAERLEKLADRNRELVDLLEDNGGIGRPKIKVESDGFNHLDDDVWGLQLEKDEQDEAPRKKVQSAPRKESAPSSLSFMINDREFDDDELVDEDEESAWSSVLDAEAQETANTNFTSQAERDLYEALQRNGAKKNANNKSRMRESA